MSHIISKEIVLAALSKIFDKTSGKDVVSAGYISSIIIRENNIGFAIEAGADMYEAAELLRKQCEEVVAQLPGAGKVTVVLTSHNPSPTQRQQKEQLKEIRKEQRLRTPPQAVPGVKHIVVVASGKGGVGKSTTAVNLACAVAKLGYSVGLLDADIYGPSIPQMMGIKGKPQINDNKMVPPVIHGVQCISMGMLIAEGSALAWRGSMATKALSQLFRGTLWHNVDVLIVDMPPGTGDVHISLAENYPVSGAVIVSTPQEVALLDAKKAIDMFAKVGVPILGVVENMSYFEDPISANRSYIFGRDGVKNLANVLDLEVLAELPMHLSIREGGDKGAPVVIQKEEKQAAGLYENLAKRIMSGLEEFEGKKENKKNQ